MRVSPASEPLRLLALLGSVAVLGFLWLVLHAHSAAANEAPWPRVFTTAVADTDSVAVPNVADSLRADSLGALASDTTETDTTRRARLYFPAPRREGIGAPLVDRNTRPYQFDLGAYWRREVLLDSTDFRYTVTEQVAGQDVRVPVETDLPTYRDLRLRSSVTEGFRELAARRSQQRRRGGLGITIDIPGGSQSTFSTIFGKNEVDLRVNGQANIDLGFDYQTNELDQAVTGRSGSLNPDFGQELSLGITGTIGDKLRINVNYDTQNQFDFENQVSLVYEGYADDIIQRVEAGNVFLQTPSELIRGGQRLFGLRTDLQFGGLNVTAVASQQDAESDALVIEGGSQTTTFDIQPYEYENNTHFFLAYHFYNWWDRGHSNPTSRTINADLQRITGVEVWLHDNAAINGTTAGGGVGGAPGAETISYATALVDLAEPGPGNTILNAPQEGVLAGGEAYLAALGSGAPLPDSTLDQYSTQELALLRDSSSTVNLEADFGLGQGDSETRAFRKLEEGVDYTLDEYLGYVSLRRALTENEVIAVSYQYLRADGSVVTVGDFGQGSTSGSTNGDRIILKLLRGNTPTPSDASWALTMRNIYRVGGRSLQADAFELNLFYEPNGSTPQTTLP
ncbi:MAG: cell surface protein SprA, partial [Rhodothermaceae bacterium]|nr:cell surface protein SprA [Rhodothermaceae bacterium]